MPPWEKQKATETVAATATSTVEAKPTAEKVQAVEWEQQAVKADTQKDLGDLAKELTLQNWTAKNEQSNKSIRFVEADIPASVTVPAASESSTTVAVESTPVTTDSTTASEKIPMEKTDAKNTMTHGNRLKEASYRKQVQDVLNTETADPKELTKIIKALQKKLEVKADGALGPNTFDKLKVEWDKSQEGNPKQTYKEFINALMGRTVDAQKPPETELNNVHISIPDQTLTAIGPDFEEQKKELEKELKHDMENGMLRVGTERINFELKWGLTTALIDRDAYKIVNNDDKDAYELNIRAMEDNVVIKKSDIADALKNGLWTILAITKPKKQWEEAKEVTIIINKEITEKTPFNYDQKWLEKGIINQGNVNYNFEFKRWDLRNFGTDPDVSSITEKDDRLSFNAKDNAPMTLSKEQFETAVKEMNINGKSSTKILTDSGTIIINKEKGEWKEPDATASYDARNTTANSITA